MGCPAQFNGSMVVMELQAAINASLKYFLNTVDPIAVSCTSYTGAAVAAPLSVKLLPLSGSNDDVNDDVNDAISQRPHFFCQ